ncbi:MAG: Asp-tRNA(Asn)/Glu-tRNA(Gln) amidotransferase subunit GatC [bacterium]
MGKNDIGKNLVKKVAYLARLRIKDGEIESLVNHFHRVLEYVKMLDELPCIDGDIVSGFVSSSPLRDDIAEKTIIREDVLINAPQTNGIYIIIPKIIKKRE